MRGRFRDQGELFSYISPEARVLANNPLRKIRELVREGLKELTPVFKGIERPWHAGVLYNRDPRFAHLLWALLKCEEGLVVGNNELYGVTDATD